MYGVNTTNLAWIASYLNDKKKYIRITESVDTVKKDNKFRVPQGKVLGLLLLLSYVNDLPNSSSLLVPIMFADDTNLFFGHSDITTLFKIVNDELMIKTKKWFSANKLLLNVENTKFSLFHKSNKEYSISPPLLKLKINNHNIERVNAMIFVGILIGENLLWKKTHKILKIKYQKHRAHIQVKMCCITPICTYI